MDKRVVQLKQKQEEEEEKRSQTYKTWHDDRLKEAPAGFKIITITTVTATAKKPQP